VRKLTALEPIGLFLFIMAYIWIWRARHAELWVAILACLVLSHLFHDESARELGFGRRSLSECADRFGPALAVLALLMLAAGLLLNTTRSIAVDQEFLALFAYLPWGLLQQYMVNGYFLNRFDRAFSPGVSAWLTAALFGAAHTPNWFLMAVTIVGGWCATQVYRRYRNLFFLGIAHATVGFLLFLTVPDSISHHLNIGPRQLHRQQVRRTLPIPSHNDALLLRSPRTSP
jgi:membrane protease YdiL (CAAX protease family)